jgi:hypothetical protein
MPVISSPSSQRAPAETSEAAIVAVVVFLLIILGGIYRAALAASERRADQAFRLADQRYRAGSIAYIDSLVAQGELVRLRLARTEADRAVAFARVDLFRALGSGQDATDHPRIDLAARDGATTISER